MIKLASFVGLQVGTCLVEGPAGMGTTRALHSLAPTTRNGRETKKNGANSWRLHHDMTSPAEDVTTGHAAPRHAIGHDGAAGSIYSDVQDHNAATIAHDS